MRTTKKIPFAIAAMLCTAILASCTKGESPDAPQEPQPIRIDTYLRDGDQITPLGVNTRAAEEATLETGYYLTGIATSSIFNTAQSRDNRIFDNEPIAKDGSYTGERRYWGTEYNSFFAYSQTSNLTNYIQFGNEANAAAKITFNQSPDPTAQTDPLIAEGVYNLQAKYNNPTVNLYFRHATSRVVTKFYLTGGVSDVYDATPSITYDAVKFTGELSVPFAKPLSVTNPNSDTYALSATQNIPASTISEATALTLGDMYLIPQTLNEGWATFSLTYKLTSTASTTETVKTLLPSLGTLQPGVRYTLYVQLMLSSSSLTVSSVTLSAWGDESYVIDTL